MRANVDKALENEAASQSSANVDRSSQEGSVGHGESEQSKRKVDTLITQMGTGFE